MFFHNHNKSSMIQANAPKDMEYVQQQLASMRQDSLRSGYISEAAATGLTRQQLDNVAADPKALGNDAAVEIQWAIKAARHAETYFNLLCAYPDKSKMKLTKVDREIYTEFRRLFPRNKFELSFLQISSLKSAASKKKWRTLIDMYKESVNDYNFGTLVRLDASLGYSEGNSEIVTRIEFIAIEVARNREGINDAIHK